MAEKEMWWVEIFRHTFTYTIELCLEKLFSFLFSFFFAWWTVEKTVKKPGKLEHLCVTFSLKCDIFHIEVGSIDWQSYFLVSLTVWPQQFHLFLLFLLAFNQKLVSLCPLEPRIATVNLSAKFSDPESQSKYL